MSTGPVFVAGLDRSGTSLLFALLASHPSLSMVRRTNMWRYFYHRYGDLSQPENLERCLDTMLRYKRLWHLKPDPARIQAEFRAGEPTYGRLFALFHRHHAERAGKSLWGDKSLHTEHYADQVFTEFPEARIIHMIRDPRDRFASVLKRYGRPSKKVGAATAGWLDSARIARRNSRRYSGRYLTVRYEDLTARPEETLRGICAFIGEPYSPEMLTMQGAPEHRQGGNSSFGQITPGAISTSPIGRYRTVLARHDLAFIQTVARRSMQALGYSPEPVAFSLRERLAFVAVYFPTCLGRMAAWELLRRLQSLKGNRIPAHRLGAQYPVGEVQPTHTPGIG